MSDSESSDVIDSEAPYESDNDEVVYSSDIDGDSEDEEQEEHMEIDGQDQEEGDEDDGEIVYDDDEDDVTTDEYASDSEKEEEEELKEKERKRLYMDDLSSDDEEAGNTVGNIPMKWYEQYDHLGYDLDGNKIMKPKVDQVDNYLRRAEDPNYKWTIYDEKNGTERVLSEKEREIIYNITHGKFPDREFNEYEDFTTSFVDEQQVEALNNAPPVKSSFVPSKWEKLKIVKIYKAMMTGQRKSPEENKKKAPSTYMMWDDKEEAEQFIHKLPRLEAPKPPLPGNKESYNPPSEYLLTKEEEERELNAHPEDRKEQFIPKQYTALRQVPLYANFLKERFNRCLDLYVCPRQLKRKVNMDPKLLLPKLPSPNELRPFPTTQCLSYEGHEGRIRNVSVDPTNQFVATSSDDKTVRIWEIETGRCLYVYRCIEIPEYMAWNPSIDYSCLTILIDNKIYMVNVYLGNDVTYLNTKRLLLAKSRTGRAVSEYCKWLFINKGKQESIEQEVKLEEDNWAKSEGSEQSEDLTGQDHSAVFDADLVDEDTEHVTTIQLVLIYKNELRNFAWHHKGDYLGVVQKQQNNSQVLIHQISKATVQNPFKKVKGQVQMVTFHPNKPFFFVATQTEVRVYNLQQQSCIKKLRSGCKWISSINIHPSGDHCIIGSYDRRVCWFDLDLSSDPYKTLRYHRKAVRQVCFHPSYPLMASCSDEGYIHIFYAKTYNDYVTNPLIVPVKVLKGHQVVNDLGVLDITFHPSQPWIFSAGADHTARLYINIP
ncbi:hypothetical protein WA158_007801 [Blastocystis sp. Blastoise]